MVSLTIYAIPYILGAVLLIALFSAFQNFRLAVQAPYFRIRRDSVTAGWRWIGIAAVASAGIVLAIISRGAVPPPGAVALPAPGAQTSYLTAATLMLTPTASFEGGLSTKDILSAPPTITPTRPAPSQTPTPFIATVESQVTPPVDAVLSITAISSGISPNLQPVNADDEFPAGILRLYVWIEYSNMVNGASWSRVLLIDGDVVRSDSEVWERGESGIAYYFFDAPIGWPAGVYEVQFYIGERRVAAQTFSVID